MSAECCIIPLPKNRSPDLQHDASERGIDVPQRGLAVLQGNAGQVDVDRKPWHVVVVVIAPGHFDVISKSVKKTDKNDARLIALHLSKDMLPKARVKSKEHAGALRGYECITSIKGVGDLSGGILLAQIGEIADFRNAGKLAAYFGIVPSVSNSNQANRSGRITKRGNKLARKILVQCAFSAARWNPCFIDFYQDLKARKGTGKTIIATARRLLNSIYYAVKNGVIYENPPASSKIGS